MSIKKLFLIAGIFSCTLVSAQIGDVAPPVPGCRVDHQGLPLNPTPCHLDISSAEGPCADAPFVFKGDKKLFSLGRFILLGPSYGLETDLTSREMVGLLTNPMEHGEASKVAIYSVADYTWNAAGYNPMDSWERALAELVPEDPEAFRLFAIHNCDAGPRFRRAESWETEVFDPADYTAEQFDRLYAEFIRMETVPARMEKACPEMLLRELRPWLVTFGAQATKYRKALDALRLSSGSDRAAFEAVREEARMSEAEKQAYQAHSTGTVVLQPFYEKLMEYLEGI